MHRWRLWLSLSTLGVGVAGFAGACGSSPSNPAIPGPYDAGGLGPGTGGGGAGGAGGSRAGDSSVPDVSADRIAPKDAHAKDGGKRPKDTGVDTAPVPPCSGCAILATAKSTPIQSVALDPALVYWTEGGSRGYVRTVSRSGGSASTYDGMLDHPLIIKVADPFIVWSAIGSGTGAGTASFQSSGPPVTAATGLTTVFGVATDGASLYWVSAAGAGAAVQSALLVPGSPGSTLGTATGSFLPQGMAVNSTSIYFAAQIAGGGGGLFELPITGGTPTEIWTGGGSSAPGDVAIDTANVYWTDQGDGAVYAMPLGGGTVTALASKSTISGLVAPVRIAVDSTNVYFSDPSGKGLYEVPTGGGTVKTLVSTSAGIAILGVAADDNDGNVYFSSPTEILSIAK